MTSPLVDEAGRATIQSLATMGGRVPMQFYIPGTGGAIIPQKAGNPNPAQNQQEPVSSLRGEAMLQSGLGGLGSFEQTDDG